MGYQFAESLRASLVELTSLARTYVQRMLAEYLDKNPSLVRLRSIRWLFGLQIFAPRVALFEAQKIADPRSE